MYHLVQGISDGVEVKYLVQRWRTDLNSHFQSGTTKHYILNEHTSHSWLQQQHCRQNLHPLISHVVCALQAAVKAATDQDIICAFKPRKLKQPILLLFETPSGFAIFTFSAMLLDAPEHMELIWAQFAGDWAATNIVWRNSFQTFEDKSDAINENTGVDERLVGMIMKWHHPGQIMAVGKPEYKKIIEERLHIPCLYGPVVMEVMWGIQNLMPSFVPEEKSLLTEEDRLPLSQELQKFLSRYDSDVKPEMVNDEIIKAAAFLYNKCVSVEMHYSVDLHEAGDCIKNLSDISCDGWSLLEIATAVKIICWPKVADNSCEMIPSDVVSKLVKDAPLYEDVFYPGFYLEIYNSMMCVHRYKIKMEKLLKSLIDEAKEAYEANQVEKPCGV